MTPNDWNQYKIFVLENMNELKEQNKTIMAQLGKLQVDVTTLKVKASLWGMFAGTVGAGITSLLFKKGGG